MPANGEAALPDGRAGGDRLHAAFSGRVIRFESCWGRRPRGERPQIACGPLCTLLDSSTHLSTTGGPRAQVLRQESAELVERRDEPAIDGP